METMPAHLLPLARESSCSDAADGFLSRTIQPLVLVLMTVTSVRLQLTLSTSRAPSARPLCLGDPVHLFFVGARRRSRSWLVVRFRAGPGLHADGFERWDVRDGGWDSEDVGDHGSELRLGLRGIARSRVWSQGVAWRLLLQRLAWRMENLE
jgi:hypothetical protein